MFLGSSFTKIAMTVKSNNIVKPLDKWWRVIFFPNLNFHARRADLSKPLYISNSNVNRLFSDRV